MADDRVFTKETWTYTGLRRSGKGLVAVWRDENGGELYYGKTRDTSYANIGGKYELEVNRDSEKTTARFVGKRWTGAYHDDAKVATWRTESAAAESEDAGERLEAKRVKENGDIGSMTLRDVRVMLANRRGYKNRAAVIAMVVDYITGG